MRELSVGSRGLEYAGGGNLNSDWVEVDDNGLLCLRYFSIDYPLGAVAESVGREVDSCKPSTGRGVRVGSGCRGVGGKTAADDWIQARALTSWDKRCRITGR